MAWTRAALALGAVVVLALLALSGGSGADPKTPPPLPGLPPPFLGTAVAGDGELTAAVDAYGAVVDLRAGPAGAALIDNPAKRQAAGTVDVGSGIVPRVSIEGGPPLPFWRADSVSQRYLPGTSVVRTEARFGRVRATVTVAASGWGLALRVVVNGDGAVPSAGLNFEDGVRCLRHEQPDQLDLPCRVGRAGPVAPSAATGSTGREVSRLIASAAVDDRAWLENARPLGPEAPPWAMRMYERSLLTLRALTDSRTGASAAGARDGWAYVWPRDAGAATIAFAAAGYRAEAERVARFLLRLDLDSAARFQGDGSPVPGRAAQGDAAGWTAVAAEAAGLSARGSSLADPVPWRDRADYHEGESGDFLANAIASAADLSEFSIPIRPESSDTPGERDGRGGLEGRDRLVRRSGDPGSGLDSAAAWAVRPFARPAFYAAVRRTLLALAADGTRFGITPGEGWGGGVDPWMAPTAWSAWGLAALAREPGPGRTARGDRRAALGLLADLRRAATPAGSLPERVDAATGVPTSTTPLAWPHAFAILALRELWPDP